MLVPAVNRRIVRVIGLITGGSGSDRAFNRDIGTLSGHRSLVPREDTPQNPRAAIIILRSQRIFGIKPNNCSGSGPVFLGIGLDRGQ